MAKLMLFLLVVLMLITGGCAQNGDGAVLAKALEDIKPALALMDARYAMYESALNATGAYLSEPDAEKLAAAKLNCEESIAGIMALPTAESALSDQDRSELAGIGLNIADYSVPFENEAFNRIDCARNLGIILYYLERAPGENESLAQAADIFTKCNSVFRKVDSLCLNEIFCKYSGKEIDSFKDEFLPELTTLFADRLPWDTDSAALIAKAHKLMDDAEADIEAFAEFVGERYLLSLEDVGLDSNVEK